MQKGCHTQPDSFSGFVRDGPAVQPPPPLRKIMPISCTQHALRVVSRLVIISPYHRPLGTAAHKTHSQVTSLSTNGGPLAMVYRTPPKAQNPTAAGEFRHAPCQGATQPTNPVFSPISRTGPRPIGSSRTIIATNPPPWHTVDRAKVIDGTIRAS